MAEMLVEFAAVIVGKNGRRYHAHACGAQMSDGKWQGWLEFVPLDGGQPIRSARETTQPNRSDAKYWATGLTPVYLEGALQRALTPRVVRHVATGVPIFDEPTPSMYAVVSVSPGTTRDAALDPFAVYENEGEAMLRRQMSALAAWHLVNIIEKYELSDEPPAALNALPAVALIDRIVTAVRAEEAWASRRRAR